MKQDTCDTFYEDTQRYFLFFDMNSELSSGFFELLSNVYLHVTKNCNLLHLDGHTVSISVKHNLFDNYLDKTLFSETVPPSELISTAARVYECLIDNYKKDLVVGFLVDGIYFGLTYFANESLVFVN